VTPAAPGWRSIEALTGRSRASATAPALSCPSTQLVGMPGERAIRWLFRYHLAAGSSWKNNREGERGRAFQSLREGWELCKASRSRTKRILDTHEIRGTTSVEGWMAAVRSTAECQSAIRIDGCPELITASAVDLPEERCRTKSTPDASAEAPAENR
jgi:hypothetical protein